MVRKHLLCLIGGGFDSVLSQVVELAICFAVLRPHTMIPVKHSDLKLLACPYDSFHVVLFVDSLHNSKDSIVYLREASCVAK